jgi:hypothetical protein
MRFSSICIYNHAPVPSDQPMNRDLYQQLIAQRRDHMAWVLLASRNAPLTLACLQSLFDNNQAPVTVESAVEKLAEAFTQYANDPQFDTDAENQALAARRELRQWISRKLIVERDGELMATDALQRALAFVQSLESQAMTSTASRLATVQREIETLAARLSHNQEERAALLKSKIASLEAELQAVERGEFEVLEGQQAVEGIREVHQLAVSLQADFRRVEDSYREADRALRQRIIGEKHHRGEIVDDLLEGHEALVETAEGQVFESFHLQLVQSAELARMKQRLREILENASTETALARRQKTDLRLLVSRLVSESERVIQARARSERDVRGFLKSGLADEQIRVGAVLQEIFQVALQVDWQSQKTRRAPAPLPPVAVSSPNLPLVERFLVKDTDTEDDAPLNLTPQEAQFDTMDSEFWMAYRALDRARLFEETIQYLKQAGKPVSLQQLALALPPTHDLETLAYWLAMAREAGIEIDDNNEQIDLFDEADGWTRFYAPRVGLSHADAAKLDPGAME